MNVLGNKFVRFQGWSSEKSFGSEQKYSIEDGLYAREATSTVSAVWSSIRRVWETGSERIKSLKKPLSFYHGAGGAQPGKESGGPKKKILDPQGPFLQNWNKIFMLVCVLALAIDPLFFYIPWVKVTDTGKCLDLDRKMEAIACVLRTVIDALYVLRIFFQFRTGFIAPPSRVFGRGELVEDPKTIAGRYLTSHFIIDILSVLPLPQIVVLIILPSVEGPVPLAGKNLIEFVIFPQYVPRLVRIYPLFKEITRTSGIVAETAWAGAVLNLFLYMLASHIIGAFWYLLSIEREDSCWRHVCEGRGSGCNAKDLYCGNHRHGNNSFLAESCPFIQRDQIHNSTVFNFGIFTDALDSGVAESTHFERKLFYCFWWGLRNLRFVDRAMMFASFSPWPAAIFSFLIKLISFCSSLGQNLKTSTFVGEILFAVFISTAGLVLFALLIGNMQKYLQSTTVRIEEMRVKRRDAEQWMSHRMLPDNLRERIRRFEQYKWQETRGVEERALIHSLPKDLRRDINRHLCLDLIKKVPMFEKMDEQILDAVCYRLRAVLYTKDSYIVREGDPVDEMLFIMRGDLVTVTTNGGRTGFFNAVSLKAGDLCGEGLFTWALDPQSSSNLPISTRTVQALSEVEAFALTAEDLKTVASQFRRLIHKDIQHTFRFFSVQWKTWAACFIQAAWRRHCRRKQAKRKAEEVLQYVLADEVRASPSLGVAIYASQFAANELRNLRQNGAKATEASQRLSLLPQKPAEPDFSA